MQLRNRRNGNIALLVGLAALAVILAMGLARLPWQRFGGDFNYGFNDIMMGLLPLPPASSDLVIAGVLSEKDNAVFSSSKLADLTQAIDELMSHQPRMMILCYPLLHLGNSDSEKKAFVESIKKYKNLYVFAATEDPVKDSLNVDPYFKDLPLVFMPLTYDTRTVRRVIFEMEGDKGWMTNPLLDLLHRHGYGYKASDYPSFDFGPSKQGLIRYRPLKDLAFTSLEELRAHPEKAKDKIVVFGADLDHEAPEDRARSIFSILDSGWFGTLVTAQRLALDINVFLKKDPIKKATQTQTTVVIFFLLLIYLCGIVFLSPLMSLWWGLGALAIWVLGMIGAYVLFDTVFYITSIALLLGLLHFFVCWVIMTRYLRQRDRRYAEQDKKLKLQEMQNELIVKSAKADLGLKLALQVAHDIRSPLLAIRMISRSTEAPPADTQKILGDSVTRLQNVADGLLARFRKNDFSEAQAGSHVRLTEFLHKIIESYQLSWSKARFEILGEPDISFYVLNQVDLETAICNLLNNALEAKPDSCHIKITSIVEGTSVRIDIEDNGPGVPEALLPRLFEAGATMAKPGGTGLGLHQVKGAIHLLGGTIEYRRGTGAHFTIRLPMQPGRQIELNLQGPIVVVEDSATHRARWQRKLQDYDVMLFSSPEEYLKSEVYSRPHNLITDLIFENSSLTGFNLLENKACLKKFVCSSLSSHADVIKMAGELNAQVLLKSQIENLAILRDH